MVESTLAPWLIKLLVNPVKRVMVVIAAGQRFGSSKDQHSMTMKHFMVAATLTALAGCRDETAETLAVSRCESLLAAQELESLPEPLRSDPRAPIKPKGEPRISDGERTTFVRRAYDRLTADGDGSRIEPRDFTCKFDKKAGKVVQLSTNGHTQEIRDSEDEWAIKQRAASSSHQHRS